MRTAQAGFRKGTDSESAADLLARLGPTLLVDIGLKSRAPAGQPPDLPSKRIRALIDTGAGADCIDDTLARSLGLPVSDEAEISGVGARHRALIYTARLYVPELDRLVFQSFAGVKLEEGEHWHRVILGRPFLRPYRTTYDDGTGAVEIVEP
jgi:hypothetical protein